VTIKKVLLVFFIALIVRIGYIWFFIEIDYLTLEDQMMYVQLGKTIAETGEFLQYTDSGYIPATDRVIGYPTFLAVIYSLFGENNMAVVIAQIFIDSLTCVIIGLISELIITRSFMVAGIVSTLNLNMVVLSGMILTDTLFLFLFSLFILFACNYIKHPTNFKLFLVILVLSFSTLVRPVSYYLVFLLLPLLIGFIVWKRASFKQVVYSLLLYIIPITIVIGSVLYQNYQQYNSFSLASQGGGHALLWIVPATYQYSGQGSYQDGQEFARDSLEDAMHKDGVKMPFDNPFKNRDYQMRVAKDALLELGFFNVLHAWSVGTVINLSIPSVSYAPAVRVMDHPSFYATPGNGVIEKFFNYVSSVNGLMYLLIITVGTIISSAFRIITIFGFYKMIKSKKLYSQNKEVFTFLLFVVIYFMAITGPIVGAKYRLPIEPIMTVFFSYAWIIFRKNKKNT